MHGRANIMQRVILSICRDALTFPNTSFLLEMKTVIMSGVAKHLRHFPHQQKICLGVTQSISLLANTNISFSANDHYVPSAMSPIWRPLIESESVHLSTHNFRTVCR